MPKLRPTRDPHTRPAIFTLERLHSELGGKILENRQEAERLGEQMQHVEAVIKMLDPGYNLARIAIKRVGRLIHGSSAAHYIGRRWTCSGRQNSP